MKLLMGKAYSLVCRLWQAGKCWSTVGCGWQGQEAALVCPCPRELDLDLSCAAGGYLSPNILGRGMAGLLLAGPFMLGKRAVR